MAYKKKTKVNKRSKLTKEELLMIRGGTEAPGETAEIPLGK